MSMQGRAQSAESCHNLGECVCMSGKSRQQRFFISVRFLYRMYALKLGCMQSLHSQGRTLPLFQRPGTLGCRDADLPGTL